MENTEEKDSKTITFIKSFIAGTLGGMACAITGHPIDTVKVRI